MSSAADAVYLDYAATTPLEPVVAEYMADVQRRVTGNPSATHVLGRHARNLVDDAAGRLATLINCRPSRLVWTSGATESSNLAILGAARYRADRGRHVITMPTEHKAVSDAFRALSKNGFEVTRLSPRRSGLLDIDRLAAAIRPDTQLVSIMHVNNETGITQDIGRIGALCRERGVLFHCDAAQSVGKLPIDLDKLPIDLMSMTAHKHYGPQGIGALFIADRAGCHIEPLMFGGGQQRGIRPGTLPVALIAAYGEVAELAGRKLEGDHQHVALLRERLLSGIRDVRGISVNGDIQHCYPGILNVSVDDVEGESLLLALEPLCVATGSACNSQNQEPSAVLRALGIGDARAQSSIRFSFGRPTRLEDVDFAAARYRDAVAWLRDLAPGRTA